MVIYCSKKLETFLGDINPKTAGEDNSILGGWNGHLFTVERKKCLIFMNNKTCYSVLMANILKKDVKNMEQAFKERLIHQLNYDLTLNEITEVKIRNELSGITLAKSNNDKKIIGTLNHHIENLKYNNYQGGVRNWDDFRIAGILNNYLVSTKILTSEKYFVPLELMGALIKKISKS